MSAFLSKSSLSQYTKTCVLPPQNVGHPFVCIQYYRWAENTVLLWACVRGKSKYTCGKKDMAGVDLVELSTRTNKLNQVRNDFFILAFFRLPPARLHGLTMVIVFQRTEELFNRAANTTGAAGNSKRVEKLNAAEHKAKAEELQREWLDVVAPVLSGLSRSKVEGFPFAVDVKKASLLATMPSSGGYYDQKSPLYKWLSDLLDPPSLIKK